ncbi:isochorismate synthase [Halobacillus mangrovi]|uniref:Isochorismate synthase MenF n=1 Tax=Halobacillus mangrovi TaxID=402384 RepID=A0A1W5ZTX5_9BACI|nr:isochorismate synthase [Halobacillus mangrovi]ARI76725.1 isochorismate synthase [Halobacillus mangrovi]
MLHTKTSHIEEIIGEAIEKARHYTEPQLISVVDQIDYIDAYQFMDHGQVVDYHRLFWRSAEEDFTMVGVGTASKLFATSERRFKEVQSLWNEIREHAVIYNRYGEKGTGVVAIGGFSFDSKQKNASPWEAFPDSQMTIPAYLLTNKSGKSFLTTNVMIFPEDHQQQIVNQIADHHEKLLSLTDHDFQLPERTNTSEVAPELWKASVKEATDDIKKGLLEKVVLARELRISFSEPVQIAGVLKALAESQDNSYIFGFESEGDYFVGATPERLAKVDKRELISTCLAGTVPRGGTEEEDQHLGRDLLHDPKNRQEHQFVVEMIKEAVEACATNVDIPEEPVLYPLKNLQHLYTPVRATLDEGYTILDVIEKLHPTPALGGLPQQSSVEYIRHHETLNRGWYAGPIGWFDDHNNGEFAVAIRSALIQNDSASLFAGCGVVEDSDPQAEYEETAVKLKPMLSVLGGY